MIHLPINIGQWIEQNSELLQPPVSNKQIMKGQGNIIQLVGGPNARYDYHLNMGPEVFYQIKGDMILKIKQGKVFKDISIKEGELFVLPPKVPHSPQRYKDTVGLVIEQERLPNQKDAMIWYCPQCHKVLYQESFQLNCIESDLVPVIDRFWEDEQNLQCKSCHYQLCPKPEKTYA